MDKKEVEISGEEILKQLVKAVISLQTQIAQIEVRLVELETPALWKP